MLSFNLERRQAALLSNSSCMIGHGPLLEIAALNDMMEMDVSRLGRCAGAGGILKVFQIFSKVINLFFSKKFKIIFFQIFSKISFIKKYLFTTFARKHRSRCIFERATSSHLRCSVKFGTALTTLINRHSRGSTGNPHYFVTVRRPTIYDNAHPGSTCE